MGWGGRATESVNKVFHEAADSCADQPFLDLSGDLWTYGRMETEVGRLARGLRDLGVQRGDRVVTMLDNGADAVVTWFAANRLGAINVPMNTAFKGEFLRHQVADSGAKVAIVEGEYLPRLDAVSAGMPDLRNTVFRGAPGGAVGATAVTSIDEHRSDDGPAPFVEVAPGDLAALIYTSGTTGPSKGCMCSHNYLVDQGFRLGELSRRVPEDRVWTPLPLFHIFAIATVLNAAQQRSTASISRRFSTTDFWPEVERTRATVVNLLGSMGVMLANTPDTETSRRCHGQIRLLLAIPFPGDLRRTWRERFGVRYPGANLYGQTEAGSMISSPVDLDVPDGSSGRRNETLDVRVFDDEDTECPPDVSGEIVVRPMKPHVMFDGYWNRPEASFALAHNYWHHTGDLGRFDKDGFFYFVDRKKDYLRRRGENISSYEVEIALMEHPDIDEVAVHAVRSDVTEDDVKATIVPAPGCASSPEDLLRWAVGHIPRFALPRYVEFRPELPKNAVGRVLKYQLRDEGLTPSTWDSEQPRPSTSADRGDHTVKEST